MAKPSNTGRGPTLSEPGRLGTIELETPQGPARVHVDDAASPAGALVLGHGAGGGVETVDLRAAVAAGRGHGLTVVRVEQPYRVAGRRSPPPAARLDEAWLAVVAALRAGGVIAGPLVVGGRSSGARVACRTAAAAGAGAVLCLAFPLHPPGRADDPAKSRLSELDAVQVPTLVVQGLRDPFGTPPPGPGRRVVTVPGDHSLRAGGAVRDAVEAWLDGVLAGGKRLLARSKLRTAAPEAG